MFNLPFLEAVLRGLKTVGIDNWADRLNYFVTTWILLFFTLVISAKQYIGSPIQCMVPAEWKNGWEEYAEDLCFINSTYVAHNFDIPSILNRPLTRINYYQWVPIVLALQGFMFYMPNVLWKLLSWQSGMNLLTIIEKAKAMNNADGATNKDMRNLIRYINASLRTTNTREVADSTGCLWKCGNWGSYASCIYLFTKAIYVANAFGQFYLINVFLAQNADEQWWGTQMLMKLRSGDILTESLIFPRVTFCDITRLRLGQPMRDVMQCVLMVNMFNEKIYLFLWFWLIFVGAVTVLDVFACASQFVPCLRRRTLRQYIRRSRKHMIFLRSDEKDEDYDGDSCDVHQSASEKTFLEPTESNDDRGQKESNVASTTNAPIDKNGRAILTPRDLLGELVTNELVQLAERTGYLDRFHSTALTNDGLLMLYFINRQAGSIVASRVVYKMFKLYVDQDMCDQVSVINKIEDVARKQQAYELRARTPYTKRALMLNNKNFYNEVQREIGQKTNEFHETVQPSRFKLGSLIGPMKHNEPPFHQMYSNESSNLPSATTMSGLSPEGFGRLLDCDRKYAPSQFP